MKKNKIKITILEFFYSKFSETLQMYYSTCIAMKFFTEDLTFKSLNSPMFFKSTLSKSFKSR